MIKVPHKENGSIVKFSEYPMFLTTDAQSISMFSVACSHCDVLEPYNPIASKNYKSLGDDSKQSMMSAIYDTNKFDLQAINTFDNDATDQFIF